MLKKVRDAGSPLIFYIYYFIFYSGSAVQGSFLTLYLTESGLPVNTIGLINGIIQILSLFVFPIIGRIADRASTKNKVHCSLLIISITILFALFWAKELILICLFRILFAMFFSPITSIEEAITLEFCERSGASYTPVYMWGSVGYSIMSFVSGFVLGNDIRSIFPLLIATYTLTLVAALMLPKSSRVTRVVASSDLTSDLKRVLAILKDKAVRNMMIIYFINMFSTSINGAYFGNHLRELGGSYSLIGIAHAVLGLSEMPFYFGPGKRFLERIGVERSMALMLAAGSVRWTICALADDPRVLAMSMAINGIQLVPVAIHLNQYLYDHAPADLKATAQSTLRHTVSLMAILAADFSGSAMHRVFESTSIHPIKGLYMCLIPLNIFGLIRGMMSIRSRKDA